MSCLSVCLSVLQSSIYSLAIKSVISLSTITLLGLIIAYHCCEVQVPFLLNCCLFFFFFIACKFDFSVPILTLFPNVFVSMLKCWYVGDLGLVLRENSTSDL